MNNHFSIIELNNSGLKWFIGKNWPILSFQNKEISTQFQKRSLWDSWCNHGFEKSKNNFLSFEIEQGGEIPMGDDDE